MTVLNLSNAKFVTPLNVRECFHKNMYGLVWVEFKPNLFLIIDEKMF